MKIGIVGLSSVGKTTLFQLLTKSFEETAKDYGKASTRQAEVPDERIDFLVEYYKPKKISYATMEFLDVAGLTKGTGNQFLEDIREVDALVHVVRLYEGDIPHVEGSIDPIRDIETVNMELLLSDLDLVEKRIDRIVNAKKKPKTDVATELSALGKCKKVLEEEKLISAAELTDAEKEALLSLKFLTEKPQIIVANTEDALGEDYQDSDRLKEYCEEKGLPLIALSAQIEREIAELSEEDQKVFLEDLGITETGIYKLARAVYKLMGLISFFTVGPDEVKAWTIEENTTAKKAAGKIHSDIERGFIRAEVFRFSDLKEQGSVNKVKEAGLLKLEGKEYIVKDGDILNIRFNI